MARGDFGGKKIHPDATMAKVFGISAMKPTEMSSKYFKYLRNKNLRDGMFVKPDENLRPIIGKGRQKAFKSIKKLWNYIKRKGLWK